MTSPSDVTLVKLPGSYNMDREESVIDRTLREDMWKPKERRTVLVEKRFVEILRDKYGEAGWIVTIGWSYYLNPFCDIVNLIFRHPSSETGGYRNW